MDRRIGADSVAWVVGLSRTDSQGWAFGGSFEATDVLEVVAVVGYVRQSGGHLLDPATDAALTNSPLREATTTAPAVVAVADHVDDPAVEVRQP